MTGRLPATADVIVAGAGPVGGFLACRLASLGLTTLICERRRRPPDRSMAIGIMPPTLRRFADIGLADELIAAGVRIRRAVVADHRRELGHLDFSTLPPPFNFILSLPQSILVDTLWRHLAATPGVTLADGVEALAFDQNRDGVQVQLRHVEDATASRVEGRYLAICDGAHGTLGTRLGPDAPLREYGCSFVMADAPDITPWGDDARLFFTPGGSLESFPLPDRCRRWVALESPALERDPETVTDDTADQEWLARRIAAIARMDISSEVFTASSRFTPSRRLRARYVHGRVALAGDAAHVMSPIGGQGMNVGVADAAQLGEALRALTALPGASHVARLRAYERSRKRAFRSASRRAAAGMWLGTRTGHVKSALRTHLISGILLRGPVRRRLTLYFAMLRQPSLRCRGRLTDPGRKRRLNVRLFTVVAPRYDLITRLLSLGRDRIWKDRLIAMLPERETPVCLDLACGTGDLTTRLAGRYPHGNVTGIDLTPGMIDRARDRLAGTGLEPAFEIGDMAHTRRPDASVDIVVGGYALRNAGDLDEALAEVFRILKPGGRAAFLDFSKPPGIAARVVQYPLLKFWGGLWGLLLHGRPSVYGYIADSLAAYPDRGQMGERLRATGFRIERSERLFGGMLALILLAKP